MQEKLNYVAAVQSKNEIQANTQASLIEQKALSAIADRKVKLTHQRFSEIIADQIAMRFDTDKNFVSRLIHNVFGFEKVLLNLEPIKFQPYFHLKEMKKLREVLNILEENGLIEIDHIFVNKDRNNKEKKRYLVNEFLPEINRNILNNRYVNPLTNEVMDKHIFYRYYFHIIHTTEKFLAYVEEVKILQTLEPEITQNIEQQIEECEHFKAVA